MVKAQHVGSLLVASAITLSLFAPAHAAEEGEAGNNLSFPVLWAEADGRPSIPGTFGVDQFTGSVLAGTLSPDSTESCWGAVQKDANNSWQAENLDAGPDHAVNTIDWGDNLEVKDWRVGNPVRVETGLYDDTLTAPMKQYEMCYISGSGQTEVWGARVDGPNGTPTPSVADGPSAMVYTSGARLTIQRIVDPGAATWDAVSHRWVGSGTTDPIFNSAVYESTADGPGSYGAELNVQGKIIYGFNWATEGLYNGEYRITFSLDGANAAFPSGSGTSLLGASILVSEETEEPVTILSARAGGGSGGGHGGGGSGGEETDKNVPVVLGDLELTYIDVALSGGEDAPADNGGSTNPPPAVDNGVPSTPVTPPPAQGVQGPENPQPVQVTAPEFAQAQIRQTAQLRAPRSGVFASGTRLVLTRKAVKTSAGVTVRWRLTSASKDNCTLRNRDGRVSALLTKPGTCRVIAFAPAPSQEYFTYRDSRTYKVVRQPR